MEVLNKYTSNITIVTDSNIKEIREYNKWKIVATSKIFLYLTAQ